MTTAATSLLGLALPVTGELSGTWGDTVNTSLTALLDTAIAGTTTLSADADVTLTTTTLASNQARQAVILWTAGGTATRTITAPAQSKTYIIVNKTSSTQSIKLVGAGPTSGITIVAAESCVAAWNGADFIKISSTLIQLASGVSGTLPIANGGTGSTTLAGASIPTYSSTDTFTNKRITARVNAQTTTTSPWAWNSDSYDQQSFSALANALTINADAGTPTDGQKTVFRFKDNGTARALTWTTGTTNSFRAIGVTLPTTTVVSKIVYVGCIYNSTDSRWDAVAVAQEA